MTQYIDKSTLVAEIKRRIKECDKLANAAADNNLSNTQQANELLIRQYTSLLHFLDTLEVKEEILDKEGKTKLMQKCVHEAYKRGYDIGVLQTTNKINHNTKEVDLEKEVDSQTDLLCNLLCYMDELSNGDSEGVYPLPENVIEDLRRFAKHFYELGLKAK